MTHNKSLNLENKFNSNDLQEIQEKNKHLITEYHDKLNIISNDIKQLESILKNSGCNEGFRYVIPDESNLPEAMRTQYKVLEWDGSRLNYVISCPDKQIALPLIETKMYIRTMCYDHLPKFLVAFYNSLKGN